MNRQDGAFYNQEDQLVNYFTRSDAVEPHFVLDIADFFDSVLTFAELESFSTFCATILRSVFFPEGAAAVFSFGCALW